MLLEARQTQLQAEIRSLFANAEVSAEAPVPGIGLVARVYPLPDLSVNFEMSGMSVSGLLKDVEGSNTEFDLSAVINVTTNFAGMFGWRRTNTDLTIDNDRGKLKFQGWYFGAAIRVLRTRRGQRAEGQGQREGRRNETKKAVRRRCCLPPSSL